MYNRMKQHLKFLNKEISGVKTQLEKLPTGNFYVTQNDKYYKWYVNQDGKKRYLNKSERSLAEQLAARKYLSLQLEDLQQEKIATQFYLRHGISGDKKAEKLLQKCPEYLNLISNLIKPKNKELKAWCEEPYETNLEYPETLTHRAISGRMMRSKSEMLIDSVLFSKKIPNRYECKLELPQKTYYPDFTIRHPKTGKIYYWEHLGRIDKEDYRFRNYEKLENYALNGIYPFVNLILTFETKNCPLDVSWVEELVKHYFL